MTIEEVYAVIILLEKINKRCDKNVINQIYSNLENMSEDSKLAILDSAVEQGRFPWGWIDMFL